MPQPQRATNPRIHALDGLRALAVILVLLYHIETPGFEGGFVGVEIFFVLSGFLITWLLMRESQKIINGESTLKDVWLDFFVRRARRLLPPLVVMLVTVTIVWMLWRPAQYDVVRQDGLAALLNVQNWWFIVHEVSYAGENAGQSPLLHLWSLSIEEQFYIVWPAILFAVGIGLRRGGLQRWNRTVVVSVLIIAVVLSGYLLFHLGHDAQDPSAAYFNTFARASALLSGAALALARMNRSHQGRGGGKQQLGWFLVAGLIICTLFLRENGNFTYAGGLFFVDIATTLLIATLVARPRGILSEVFAHPIGAWIGSRSYAIYIWHWPILIWLDQNNATGWNKVGLGLAVIGLSVLFAELSWWLIERPSKGYGRRTFNISAIVVGATAVFALLIPVFRPYTPPAYLTNAPVHYVAPSTAASTPPGATAGATEPVPGANPGANPDATPGASTTSTTPAPAPVIEKPTDCGVSLVGDSVLLAAQNSVTKIVPNVRSLDAQVGMQFDKGMDLITEHLGQQDLGCVVVIALGTNGSYNSDGILNFTAKLPATSRVVLVNTQAPRSWTASVNNKINTAQAAMPQQISIFNWQKYALEHPEKLAEDKIHMGSKATEDTYAQMLLDVIQASGAGTPAAAPAAAPTAP